MTNLSSTVTATASAANPTLCELGTSWAEVDNGGYFTGSLNDEPCYNDPYDFEEWGRWMWIGNMSKAEFDRFVAARVRYRDPGDYDSEDEDDCPF